LHAAWSTDVVVVTTFALSAGTNFGAVQGGMLQARAAARSVLVDDEAADEPRKTPDSQEDNHD
jgi:hypothetical protein